ncbi:MAG: pilus assembly protein PilP [Gammaproteobacteria bacterium]|nr:pilus assembly protein PilP [Gammaproteobacteria bacterium]
MSAHHHNRSRSWRTSLVLSLATLLLAACSSGEFADLQGYIADVKAKNKGRIEPMPEFSPPANFAYAAMNLDDPFVTWDTKLSQENNGANKKYTGTGPHPDFERRREPMESFPLDTLHMVGTMRRGKQLFALVQTPDGLVSRVVPGNYLGQNHGRILNVNEEKIELVEIVPDGLGGWLERPATMSIVE